MGKWDMMGPHAKVGFAQGPSTERFEAELDRVAGLKRKTGYWLLPYNATDCVAKLADDYTVRVQFAQWSITPPKEAAWDDISAALRAGGEARPEYLDSFLKGYQKEALEFGWNRLGVNYFHPTGCLSGDTKLTVNRAGKSFSISLGHLAYKFHGGSSLKGMQKQEVCWDPNIPTRARSEVAGFIRLNNIVDVFRTGKNEVFRVSVGAREIEATKDHRFLTPDGYRCLSDLFVGDLVMVEGPQGKKGKKPKPLYRQRGVRHHPFAVVVDSPRSDSWCVKRGYKIGYVERSYRVAEHRLVAEAQLNGLSIDAFLQRVRSGNLTGLSFLDPSDQVVHHQDGNADNNGAENLEILSSSGHFRLHGEEGGWEHVAYTVQAEAIDSIEVVGVKETYDMTMEVPHNSYVAEGFVVHNSGKTLVGTLTMLSVAGAALIVTRAASRIQFAREIRRFTYLKPYIIRPSTEQIERRTVNGQTWQDYVKEHMPELRSMKLVGEEWAKQKLKYGVQLHLVGTIQQYLTECATEGRRPVIVVGWEALSLHLRFLKTLYFGTILFDESHRAKNSKRWEVIPLKPLSMDPEEMLKQLREEQEEERKLGGFSKTDEEGRKLIIPVANIASAAADLARQSKKRVNLTATPIKDRVRDLYSQLDLCEPNCWGNATTWLNRYADRHPGAYGGYDTTGSSNLTELKSRMRTCSHILAYEVTHKNLPPKRRISFYVAPEDQCKPAAGFGKERKEAASRGPTAVLEVNLAESASRKRKAVQGIIEDHLSSNQKVVVFTGRRRDCEALAKNVRGYKKDGIQVWSAHGEDSTKRRQAILDEYMAHPGPCILVGTGDAFGESLDIQDTDAALFVMLPYTPGQLRQWEGRFCRQGQKRAVLIYYVICEGTVDEHMASILIDKLPAVEEVIEDKELAAAEGVLAGYDENETSDEFAKSILDSLDFG